MPRTVVTPVAPPTPGTPTVFSTQAFDTVNGNAVPDFEKCLIYVYNGDTSPRWVSFSIAPTADGIPGGTVAQTVNLTSWTSFRFPFYPFAQSTDGNRLWCVAENNLVRIGAIYLPSYYRSIG